MKIGWSLVFLMVRLLASCDWKVLSQDTVEIVQLRNINVSIGSALVKYIEIYVQQLGFNKVILETTSG